MFAKAFTTAAVALAASSLVSAQTFTDCNPLEKTCPADPAFGKDKVECDFTKGDCSAFAELPGTSLKYDDKGAHFEIAKESNAPTIATGKYIFFGRLDVEVQASSGQGIVTSLVLQSDDLDEVDWEWVGGDAQQVQTNYFSKGDTSVYDRGAYHGVADPLTTYHTYSVDWTKERIEWLIDGNVVRTLKASEAKGGSYYPQTPMQVKLGTWCAGGKNTAKGTVEWAGGYTDFSEGPFNAYYKKVTITDYAGGDSATSKSIKEYTYGDHSGSWESIKVKTGDAIDDEELKTSHSSSLPASKTTQKPLSHAYTGSATVTGTGTGSGIPEPTKSGDKTSKTEEKSEIVTKTEAGTTLTTAVPKTSGAAGGSNSTVTSGSGSDNAGGETPTPTGSDSNVSTVPESAGVRAGASLAMAAAGLFLAQLLI